MSDRDGIMSFYADPWAPMLALADIEEEAGRLGHAKAWRWIARNHKWPQMQVTLPGARAPVSYRWHLKHNGGFEVHDAPACYKEPGPTGHPSLAEAFEWLVGHLVESAKPKPLPGVGPLAPES